MKLEHMPNEPEKLQISVSATDQVTALLYLASKGERLGVTVLLGHGAGAGQQSSFMKLFASELAARGLDAMTFNFIYMERGRSVPDQKLKLESCYRVVIEEALKQRKLKNNRLVIGGKSMGGRIASQDAASVAENNDKLADSISGVVFLGYPLHPPGNPQKLRAEHLKDIQAPMLFVQGARDAFGTADEITAIIKQFRLPAPLYVIEGGDHSLKVPKRVGTQEQIYKLVLDEIRRWVLSL